MEEFVGKLRRLYPMWSEVVQNLEWSPRRWRETVRFPKTYNMSRFCYFSNLTFDDLSRPQMTSDHKNSNRFISSLVSAFQKHIGWKKSKKSLFRSIFKYANKERARLFHHTGLFHHTTGAPHAPQCTTANKERGYFTISGYFTIPWVHLMHFNAPHHLSTSVLRFYTTK